MKMISKVGGFKFLHLFSTCICAMFVVICILTYSLLSADTCNCHTSPLRPPDRFTAKRPKPEHNLAVLVPFRDRFEELLVFAPYIHDFLNKQSISHDVFILNQIDGYRFNRASLINVGYTHTKGSYDYMAMHDVDLLPLNPNLSYAYPRDQPFHIAAPHLHPKYHYPTFVGGILLINREHFATVDGMSNKYWGWGLEDDEFYVRLKEAGLNVSRPVNITTGTSNTFKHIHDKNRRKRDMAKCFNQREVTRKRDRQTGLHNVAYKLHNVNNVTIDGAVVRILNIELICDKEITPWCDCSQQKADEGKKNQQ